MKTADVKIQDRYNSSKVHCFRITRNNRGFVVKVEANQEICGRRFYNKWFESSYTRVLQVAAENGAKVYETEYGAMLFGEIKTFISLDEHSYSAQVHTTHDEVGYEPHDRIYKGAWSNFTEKSLQRLMKKAPTGALLVEAVKTWVNRNEYNWDGELGCQEEIVKSIGVHV